MPSIVTGIDASLTGTAICALSLKDLHMAHVCTLTAPKGVGGIQRLRWLSSRLHRVLCEVAALAGTSEKMHIFIEGYAFCARGASVVSLGELGGIYRLLLAKRWGGYNEIPPTSMKKFICGKGNANKNVVLEQCYRKFAIGSDRLRNDNEVDAYCLARMGAAFLGTPGYKMSKIDIVALKGIGEKCTL